MVGLVGGVILFCGCFVGWLVGFFLKLEETGFQLILDSVLQ